MANYDCANFGTTLLQLEPSIPPRKMPKGRGQHATWRGGIPGATKRLCKHDFSSARDPTSNPFVCSLKAERFERLQVHRLSQRGYVCFYAFNDL